MKFIENSYLYETKEIITSNQIAKVTSCIGYGYKTTLSYANSKIIAIYKNYEDVVQIDFNNPILFEFNKEVISINAINGVAEINFDIVNTGTYVVKTINENIENGEVIING